MFGHFTVRYVVWMTRNTSYIVASSTVVNFVDGVLNLSNNGHTYAAPPVNQKNMLLVMWCPRLRDMLSKGGATNVCFLIMVKFPHCTGVCVCVVVGGGGGRGGGVAMHR